MKEKVTIGSVLLVAPFLTLAPTLMASTTWYVNGVNGSDSNNCKSPTTPCKAIGHAISLASSGDTIMVAAATYVEHLTIRFSLTIVGSGARTTIIDGGHSGTVITVPSGAHVALSKLTIRNAYKTGYRVYGGGISNTGTLTLNDSTASGNTAFASGCTGFEVCDALGEGIYNYGTLTINNSTVSGNTVAATGASWRHVAWGAASSTAGR